METAGNPQRVLSGHREEKALKEFVQACGNVYAIMATIFNPDTIIIGGGVPEMTDFPQKDLEKVINESTGKDVMAYGFDYVYSSEFVGKGVVGAAVFARRRLQERK